jgi:hypothetical protein
LVLNSFAAREWITLLCTLLENRVSGGDEVYLYSSTSGFPTNTCNSLNYWVDVVYQIE